MEFAVGVRVFVLLQLLLEFCLGDVDCGIHIYGALAERDSALRQVHDDLTSALLLAIGFGFL